MIQSWKLISEEIYPGLTYRKVAKRVYELQDGQQHVFDIILNREVIVPIAITPENKIVIAVQYRPGPNKILMELPGGVIDPGETPEQAVKRELLEETGYTGDFEYVGKAYRDAYSTVVMHTFVVKNAHKVQEPQLEPDEFIEVRELTIDEFRALLRTGDLTDVTSGYQALDYLNLL